MASQHGHKCCTCKHSRCANRIEQEPVKAHRTRAGGEDELGVTDSTTPEMLDCFITGAFFIEPDALDQDEAAQRQVDPREVTARMDSAIVRAVLRMDVPRRLVKQAIKKRLAENGEDFTSAEALLEAVFSLDFGTGGDGEETGELQEPMMSPEGAGLNSGNSTESSSTDSMRLMEENRQLKEQRQCKICMDEEVCVAFLPCGHLVCCATCAPALNACPICRAKIRGTVRTYMS
ncbi:baculoviral IAP repeat-containing protein 3-like [Elysia marginata]|uniref:Baculoviral IAP repeat-containing protein 3-like n=1 Tax=Elysia marginata TaxID=1093978 RepID=A0AAV4G435_9GAST|nr:baculoviral IAP repeat-containing protein 3-like [Elysia marginata]